MKMLQKRTVYWAAGVFAVTFALAMADNQSTVSPAPTPSDHTKAQGSFLQGFIASLSVVVVSELGDKTFFIAAIMAMKHPRLIVFTGAISALVFMTVLSALFGSIATVIPRVYTYYISAALFAIFGIKMLRDGCKMDPNEGQEELEEVQMELKRREDQVAGKERSRSLSPEVAASSRSGASSPHSVASSRNGASPTRSEARSTRSDARSTRSDARSTRSDARSTRSSTSGSQTPGPSQPRAEEAPGPPTLEPTPGPSKQNETLREEKEETLDMLEQGQAENRRRRRNALIKVLLQAATLTFLAEWGDRSQLATIVLATREDVFGVIVGGSLGHAMCTGLAVVGGRMIAQRISVRTVTIIGGVVFLLFAVSALFISPDE